MDMTGSIEPKSDQMNAEDLLGGPRTFTITDVRHGTADQPVNVYVAEHPQPFKPSKTVRRLMVVAWGPDTAAYIGKRMTLYRDPDVKWGGEAIGGIRVSHMSGLRAPLKLALTVTRGKRAPYVVEPLADAPPVVPLADRVQTAIGAWSGKGVTLQQLEQWVGVDRSAWSDQTLADLQGLWRSLATGETTLLEVWPPAEDAPAVPPVAEPSDLDLEPSDEEIARSEGQPR
jgi:hypothetical protein